MKSMNVESPLAARQLPENRTVPGAVALMLALVVGLTVGVAIVRK